MLKGLEVGNDPESMDYGLPALCFFAEVSFDAVC